MSYPIKKSIHITWSAKTYDNIIPQNKNIHKIAKV